MCFRRRERASRKREPEEYTHRAVLEKHNDGARQRDHNHEKGHVIEQVLPVEDHPSRQLRGPKEKNEPVRFPPLTTYQKRPKSVGLFASMGGSIAALMGKYR